jgi:hypothetical protein
MNIADINCGVCKLINYLPDTCYHYYYANDLDNSLVRLSKKELCGVAKTNIDRTVIIERLDDRKVPRRLADSGIAVDVLCCLGFGHQFNHHESQTVKETLLQITDEHKPQYIIVGVAEEVDNKTGHFTDLCNKIKTRGYIAVKEIRLNVDRNAEGEWLNRLISFFEREE